MSVGVRECARVCAGVRGYVCADGCARVWVGVRGYCWVCAGVVGCARGCAGVRGCVHVCGMNFQNFFWRLES